MDDRRRPPRDGGLSLVEILITVAVTGLIVGALSAATMVVLRNQSDAANRNDASNGALGLTNYFPTDIAATPPGGRETDPDLPSGCSGSSDPGRNIVRLTYTEFISGTTTSYRVAYRLVPAPDGSELRRISCSTTTGTYGPPTVRRVAFALAAIPPGWAPGMAPASLAPLSGDGAVTLTLTTAKGLAYTVQGTRMNPAAKLDPSDPPAPNLALETSMSLTIPNYSSVGEVLTFTVTVSNTGAVPVTNITTTYANAVPATSCGYLLAPGVTSTCTATHTVTQDDLDKGTITASVAAAGYYSSFSTAAVATASVNAAAAPSLSAILTSAVARYDAPDAVIAYTMAVTNTGNITMVDVTPSFSNATVAGPCSPLPVAPGSTTFCTATKTVSSAEYTADITNVGTATGSTANFGPASATSAPLVVPFVPNPRVNVTSFTVTPTPFNQKDDVLTFSVALTNTGNVDLTNAEVTYSVSTSSPTCPSSIARGATVTCTASYTVNQDDMDRGSLTVVATGEGGYDDITVTATGQAVAPANGRPSISLLLTSSATQYTTVGQILTYTLKVTNVGSVTLTGINPSYTNAVAATACTPLPLPVGATATCTATHTVTSAEMGTTIAVSASAAATSASAGGTPTITTPAVAVSFLAVPQVTVTSLVANPTPFTAIGQTVTASVSIANTGNVALGAVAVAWANATTATNCPTNLAVGAVATCTATHLVTSTDSIAGFAVTATVSGTYAGTTATSQAVLNIPSAVPCTVVSPTSGGIAAPTSVALVATNGPNKGFLESDVVVTVQTSALCNGLRIKYFPQSPNSVIADMTKVSSGVWRYTIPGQNGAGPATWKTGVKSVQVLPAAQVGGTAIYTNSSAFTVT